MKQSNDYKIPFRWRSEIYFLKPEEILWIQADENYSKITLEDGSLRRCQVSLKDLTTRLSPYNFFRSHRSWLINLNHLDKVNLEEQWLEFSQGLKQENRPLLSRSAAIRLSRISGVNHENINLK